MYPYYLGGSRNPKDGNSPLYFGWTNPFIKLNTSHWETNIILYCISNFELKNKMPKHISNIFLFLFHHTFLGGFGLILVIS